MLYHSDRYHFFHLEGHLCMFKVSMPLDQTWVAMLHLFYSTMSKFVGDLVGWRTEHILKLVVLHCVLHLGGSDSSLTPFPMALSSDQPAVRPLVGKVHTCAFPGTHPEPDVCDQQMFT